MPVFSGNYLEWQSFFDLFDSLVHKNPTLKNSQRLYFLKTNLAGEAASLISHLKIEDTNYQPALQKLKARYDKPREIANQHIKRFLAQPTLTSSSAHGLRSLHDVSDEVIRALNAMDREDRNTWLLFILSEKVDPDTKQLWCQKIAEMEEAEITLERFLKFVESRSFALQSAQTAKPKTSVPFKEPSKPQPQSRSATAFVATNPPFCNVCCKQNHHLYQCGKFLHMSHNERLSHVNRKKLCNNFLKVHPGESCKSGTCRKCGLPHHSLLHPASSSASPPSFPTSSVTAQANPGTSAQSLISALDSPSCLDTSNILLATVAINVLDVHGRPHACRAVLDCASQVSFISESFCKQLGLKTIAADMDLEGISSTLAHADKCAEIIVSSRCSDYRTSVSCVVLEKITRMLPGKPANIDDWSMPGSIHLADPLFHRPGKVEVLLGIELFFQLLEPGKIAISADGSLPTLQNTKLGWVVAGRYQEPNTSRGSQVSTCLLASTEDDLSQQLRKFWELEEYAVASKHLTEEEQRCEQHFAEHTYRNESGKFVVRLPFLHDPNQLGESRQIAEKRFHHIEKKLVHASFSRGTFPDQLQVNPLWWHGPAWEPSYMDSESSTITDDLDTDEQRQTEREQRVTAMTCIAVYENRFMDEMMKRFYPNLKLLLRTTARMLRFRYPEFRNFSRLSSDELDYALQKYVQHIQQQHFSGDLSRLQRGLSVTRSSPLHQLKPFLDENGVAKVGGRLQQSDFSYDNKHPILLPRHSILTSLILLHEHQEHLHCGPQSLLAACRTRFWILRGISAARKVCRDCVICSRALPARITQQMGQYPVDRLKPFPPFTITGVDYAGPVNLVGRRRRGAVPSKGYIALFVCFGTRAVHLEAVSDLSASAFLAAFTRFTSRYGVPSKMYSDNATNLRAAAKKLRELYQQIDFTEHSDEVNDFLTNKRVQWLFIPARSPHHGGLWEAGIKVARGFLSKTGEVNHLEQQMSALSRWNYVQRLAQDFRARWQSEYVLSLQRMAKWQASSPNVAVGDFVLLVDDHEKPQQWPLGRILELFPGSDGLVRVVSVKTGNNTFRRDVRKLRRFPLDSDEYLPGQNGSEIPTRNCLTKNIDDMVQCGGSCGGWFHYGCVGFDDGMKPEQWKCSDCTTNNVVNNPSVVSGSAASSASAGILPSGSLTSSANVNPTTSHAIGKQMRRNLNLLKEQHFILLKEMELEQQTKLQRKKLELEKEAWRELVDKLPAHLMLDWSLYKRQFLGADLRAFGAFMTNLVSAAAEETLTLDVGGSKAGRTEKAKGFINAHSNTSAAKESVNAQQQQSKEGGFSVRCLVCESQSEGVRAVQADEWREQMESCSNAPAVSRVPRQAW
ncbi:uncharacterized protein LOC129774405 [Toxorhynchites rutilus septentrionalis]|uniref:uncharacterized protein LOC129774405 n=1 Tax=Toxorhynchites rutilus septentrionalis TaxID=329112 RepID=UPI0024786CEB|nr:uncharacterized protein LOC129774405 [Toxorhynchites rutilus septentrionalis]